MILHGLDGYSQKSPENASYYYTYSRLPTNGTLENQGAEILSLRKRPWLDREWSSQILSKPYLGWYWFSLIFDDGRELVLFELHSDDRDVKTLPTATWIEPDGTTISIPKERWTIRPTRYWKSYPVEWILEVGELRYVVEGKVSITRLWTQA